MRVAILLCAGLILQSKAISAPADSSPRWTRAVQVIRQSEPSIVAVFSLDDAGQIVGSGTGSIIHEDGFILTAYHVAPSGKGVVLLGDTTALPFKVVGETPEKDILLLKVESAPPLKRLALGHTDDLMAGEPVVVGGNPGGRGVVFSSGIVSSPGIMIDAPSALVAVNFPNDVRDRYIQFDASCNAGNSGGPLINAEGFQVGLVARKSSQEQNISFAIPADRIRQHFWEMLAPEENGGFELGVKVNMLTNRAVVSVVETNSPAYKAGLRRDDVILTANGKTIRDGIDWALALVSVEPGQSIKLRYERGGERHELTVKTVPFHLVASKPEEGKKPGLNYKLYYAQLTRLPDFAELKPVASGQVEQFETSALAKERKDFYALVFDGFIRVPKTGRYRLTLLSDDGSRLWLDDRPLIDNDGLHPAQAVGAVVRLVGGLHPIHVEYFQGRVDAVLQVFIQFPDGRRREVDSSMLFHD